MFHDVSLRFVGNGNSECLQNVLLFHHRETKIKLNFSDQRQSQFLLPKSQNEFCTEIPGWRRWKIYRFSISFHILKAALHSPCKESRVEFSCCVNQVMLVVLCEVMCLQVSAGSWVQAVGVVLGLYLCCREMPRESGCRRVLVSRALMVDLLLRLEVLIRWCLCRLCRGHYFKNKLQLVTWNPWVSWWLRWTRWCKRCQPFNQRFQLSWTWNAVKTFSKLFSHPRLALFKSTWGFIGELCIGAPASKARMRASTRGCAANAVQSSAKSFALRACCPAVKVEVIISSGQLIAHWRDVEMQAYSKTSKLGYMSKILQSPVPLLSKTWCQVLVDLATTFHTYWKHQLHPRLECLSRIGLPKRWNYHPDLNHKILQNFGDSQHRSIRRSLFFAVWGCEERLS